jgi:hypothetical protein
VGGLVWNGARILDGHEDAGAGDAPYKGLFRHARYESADFEKVDKTYARTTYGCDLKNLPVKFQARGYPKSYVVIASKT